MSTDLNDYALYLPMVLLIMCLCLMRQRCYTPYYQNFEYCGASNFDDVLYFIIYGLLWYKTAPKIQHYHILLIVVY